jgi:hypothetical protein
VRIETNDAFEGEGKRDHVISWYFGLEPLDAGILDLEGKRLSWKREVMMRGTQKSQ